MRLSGVIVQFNRRPPAHSSPAQGEPGELSRAEGPSGVLCGTRINAPERGHFPMPADLPSTPAVVAFPYYRVIAFIIGGSITLALFLLVTSFLQRLFSH
jgi:hypothetical protein